MRGKRRSAALEIAFQSGRADGMAEAFGHLARAYIDLKKVADEATDFATRVQLDQGVAAESDKGLHPEWMNCSRCGNPYRHRVDGELKCFECDG